MGQLGRIQAVHEEGGGKNDLGSQCTMVGSPVDQGVSIRLDTGRKKGIKKNATEVLKISRTELMLAFENRVTCIGVFRNWRVWTENASCNNCYYDL